MRVRKMCMKDDKTESKRKITSTRAEEPRLKQPTDEKWQNGSSLCLFCSVGSIVTNGDSRQYANYAWLLY